MGMLLESEKEHKQEIPHSSKITAHLFALENDGLSKGLDLR